jgi:tRNA pseudouridine38-40 synthase
LIQLNVADQGRNIKLVLQYDGTGLCGWQRQKNQPTIQEHLETALSRLCDEPITITGAGRTDAGVHALGQAANFYTTAPRTLDEIISGGNALLPNQIAILSAEPVPHDFHARYSAASKVYYYDLFLGPVRPVLRRNFVWHVGPHLDMDAMNQALKALLGEHDFASFQSTGTEVKTTVRTMLRADMDCLEDDIVRITFEANGFLRHMVRALVGTLVEIGRGKLNSDQMTDILASQDRDQAGPTAPPQGLFLKQVIYP